jgi:hypothetical protein
MLHVMFMQAYYSQCDGGFSSKIFIACAMLLQIFQEQITVTCIFTSQLKFCEEIRNVIVFLKPDPLYCFYLLLRNHNIHTFTFSFDVNMTFMLQF